MWVIKDEDSTIYLIGTLHLLRRETEWNSAKVKKAVRKSSELWLEIANPGDQSEAVPLVQQYGFDHERMLSSRLNAKQKEKLARVAAEYAVPLANLEPMKPWLAALVMVVLPLQKAGLDPNAGVDLCLCKEAERDGDRIMGFETLEEQTKMLADLPEPEQIAFFNETLDDVDKGIEYFDQLASAWLRGDTNALKKLAIDDMRAEAPELYEKLLVQRNVRWSEKIAKILNGAGVQMIAVGMLHLVGPDSLQVQLAKRGIKASRL